MLSNAINNLKPVYPNSLSNSSNSIGMYSMMRSNNMEAMRQPNSYMNVGMGDIHPMMMPNVGFTQSSTNISQSTPTKVGFSPTVPQADPQMGQTNQMNPMGPMNDQQLLILKQQVNMYKELCMQLWQNQQRGIMPGQQLMPNMNSTLPNMGSMGQMTPQLNPQIGMNPFGFIPGSHGFH